MIVALGVIAKLAPNGGPRDFPSKKDKSRCIP